MGRAFLRSGFSGLLPVIAGFVIAAPACAQRGSGSYEQAVEQLSRGDYEDALDLLASLLRQDNGLRAEVVRTAVLAYAEVGRYDIAVETAIDFASENPSSAEVANALGEVYALRGDHDLASEAFQRAIRGGAPDSLRAELNLALLDRYRGRRDSSETRLDRFIDYYNSRRQHPSQDLTSIATAARHLGARDPGLFEDAVRVYDEAIVADGGNIRARVLIGDLLLEKYNNTEAREAFQQALSKNPNHPDALLGMARSMHFDGMMGAMDQVQRGLEVNPNHVPARVQLARLFVELEDYGGALGEIGRALEVNPNSLEALSVRAAIEYLTGEDNAFLQTERAILDRSPRYAELYNTLAELSARNRLYDEATRFARKAVELDPTSWRGHGLLGMNQLRTGQIAEGRRSLEFAFEGDPYNVWIKNTLDLADTFSEFNTVETERFRIVIHRDESDILGPYFTEVAEEAYRELANRYGDAPPTPIRVEVYPGHADFSVRTVGIAGIGALGVSFGPVIAMDSPSARQRGEFNWGSTLWHEIAHTFHLHLTDNRVPRWFSEGLAVYEERRAREGWGDDASVGFLVAFREDRLLPVSELNNGFVRPSYPQQIGHSYYQASLVCEFIERESGDDALTAMLRAFGGGQSSREAIESVVGMGEREFDSAFVRFMRERFRSAIAAVGDWSPEGGTDARPTLLRRAESDPRSFPAQLRAGRSLFDEGDRERAAAYFERARDLFPEYAAADSPYWYLATIYKETGRLEEAILQLEELTRINANDYRSYIELAALREQLGDEAGAAEALERAQFVDPYEIDHHARMADWFEAAGDWARAERERRVVVGLNPVDITEARYLLARTLFRAGKLQEARSEVLRSLERAPNYEAAQELLLEIRSRMRSN